jgi:DNA polymerase-3 subunit gamma/tau
MSYQVLARKWRPKSFREMAGQEHVLKALINALDHNRLHHAYLFTGTRGVGKTTIARILAKCLNCEAGVSSQPCGSCASCTQINEGRFVDLIEIDAASHTGVDDVRDLIDNSQYLPSSGRFKVYLIDEVHMLSKNAFNALLKTLEEPPPHVKFLLATTDPQKLPVTILSRCLQFNLKNLGPERIVEHLKYVLGQEMIPFEDAALWQLGRAADGSMRDALSLTDQAIGFSNGKLTDEDIRSMLGSINQQFIVDLVNALIKQDFVAVLETVNQLSEHNPDYNSALNELASLFHQIAIAQALPDAETTFSNTTAKKLASQIRAEDVQLYYQLAIHGQRDLPLAPDLRAGFEMILLRMFAFKPHGVPQLPKTGSRPAPATSSSPEVKTTAKKPEPTPAASELVQKQTVAHQHTTGSLTRISIEHLSADNWYLVFNAMGLSGVTQNTAAHCVLDNINRSADGVTLHFTLDDKQSALFNQSHQERLSSALSQHFGIPVNVSISVGNINRETPAAIQQRQHKERLIEAQNEFASDEQVQIFLKHFDAKILTHTIKPTHH